MKKKNPYPLPLARIKKGNKSLTRDTKNYKKEKKQNPCHPPPLSKSKM